MTIIIAQQFIAGYHVPRDQIICKPKSSIEKKTPSTDHCCSLTYAEENKHSVQTLRHQFRLHWW